MLIKTAVARIPWVLVVVYAHCAIAGELKYAPTNPSFGGNPYNAQWLMSEAQAQNEYEAKKDFNLPSRDPLEDFKESLNRQILSKLSREIVAGAFGDTTGAASLQEGSYQIGDYMIEITPKTDVISIMIMDDATGNQTVIEIPYYGSP